MNKDKHIKLQDRCDLPNYTNNKKTRFEATKEKWAELKQKPDIAKYVTIELYRKIKHCVQKIQLYIDWTKTLEVQSEVPYLLYTPSRLIGDALIINIFPICEMLELNEKYLPKLSRLGKLSEVSNQPLLIWYIIGTYMKHSYKSFLPYNANLSKMSGNKKFEFIFDHYSDDILGLKNIENEKLDSLSADWKLRRREAFQKVYFKWYDYLYVRMFGKGDEKSQIVKKMNDKKSLTDEELTRLRKWNTGRSKMINDMLGFFQFLLSKEETDKDKPYNKTYLYKNAEILWEKYVENKK